MTNRRKIAPIVACLALLALSACANQIDAGACKLCPPMSESPEASTSRAACVCLEGYYDNDPDPLEVECVLCPVGTACEGGYARDGRTAGVSRPSGAV